MFGASASYSQSSTTSSGSGSEQSNSVTQRLNSDQINYLSNLLGTMGDEMAYDPNYSKDAAIADSQGIVDNIFRSYRESSLPNILERQTQTGAYSGTGTQLLANDAYARTTSQASEAVMNAIMGYADIQNQRRATASNAMSSILGGLLSAREETTASSQFRTDSQSKTTGMSVGASFGM